jgi:hypothetical protein
MSSHPLIAVCYERCARPSALPARRSTERSRAALAPTRNAVDTATTRAFKSALVGPQAPKSTECATDGGAEQRAGDLQPRVSDRTTHWIGCPHNRDNKSPIEEEHSRASDGRWNYPNNSKISDARF